jgi:translation initiation factor 1 (eIF-1/SUI1)
LRLKKRKTVANTTTENKNPDEKKKPEEMIPVEETKMIEIFREAKSKRESIKDIYNIPKYDIEMNEEIASSIKKQFKSNSFNNWIGTLTKVENSATNNSLGFKIKLINSNVKMSNYGLFINDSEKYGIKKKSKLFEIISKLPLDSKIKLSGQFVKSELYDYISRDYGIPIILTQIEQINE